MLCGKSFSIRSATALTKFDDRPRLRALGHRDSHAFGALAVVEVVDLTHIPVADVRRGAHPFQQHLHDLVQKRQIREAQLAAEPLAVDLREPLRMLLKHWGAMTSNKECGPNP